MLDRRREHDQGKRSDRDQQESESRSLTPNGLSIRRDLLEKVDRRVHDDPHYVDEVPVDSRQLDAVVVLGEKCPRNPRMITISSRLRPTKT